LNSPRPATTPPAANKSTTPPAIPSRPNFDDFPPLAGATTGVAACAGSTVRGGGATSAGAGGGARAACRSRSAFFRASLIRLMARRVECRQA
jgi:hypothetical protein